MLNILLFIIFMSVYLVGQIQENKYISRKLTMISIVNQKLQRYAVATEKSVKTMNAKGWLGKFTIQWDMRWRVWRPVLMPAS